MGFADAFDDTEGRAPAAADAAADLAAAESLYRGMSRSFLMDLRATMVVDRVLGRYASEWAWITARIELIDRLLDE